MRAAALAMAVINILLFFVCESNVAANNLFALKATSFYDTVIISSSVFYWIVPASLLLWPLWWHVSRKILPELSLPPAVLIASCLLAFPFFAIDLSAPLPWIDLVRASLRDGLVQPAAFLFALVGLRGLRETRPVEKPHLLVLVCVLCVFALRLIAAGPAIPRLEDETGYHIQSLIFASGTLKGQLPALPGIAGEAVIEALRLPFLGMHESGYYSQHMHGWPALLALARTAGFAGFAAALLWVLNLGLFYLLARKHVKDDRVLALALLVFGLSPLLMFLSGTMMAHTAALTLSLLILFFYERTGWSAAGVFGALLAALTAAALFQTRPQALLPLFAALFAASIIEIARNEERRENLLRMGALAGGAAAGWFFFNRYAALFGADFPVNKEPCNAPGFGPGHGCFPTYGTLGHTPLKAFFNTADLFSGWNHELAVGGLPLLVLALWLLTRTRGMSGSRMAVVSVATLALSILQYGQFFHNGGESYHGRYLADSAFALPLLLGILLEKLPNREGFLRHAPAFLVPSCILAGAGLVLFQIRGEYFHPYFEPFRTAGSLPGGENARNALLFIEEKNDDTRTIDAFTGRLLVIPRAVTRRSLNLGAGTLAATAVRKNEQGFLEDQNGNILAGEMPRATAASVARSLNRRAYVLRFSTFEPVSKSSRLARFFKRSQTRLEPVD